MISLLVVLLLGCNRLIGGLGEVWSGMKMDLVELGREGLTFVVWICCWWMLLMVVG